MTVMPLSVVSSQVMTPTRMTADLLGAEVANACLRYWRHELGPLTARLTKGQALLIASLAAALGTTGKKPLVAFYPPGDFRPQQLVVERTFTRGRWSPKRKRLLAVECTSTADLARLLELAWSEPTNDSVIVLLGAEAAALDFIRERFVDDTEANPTNEEGLLLDCAALLSRGWDGLDARILSRKFGPAEVGQALAAAQAPPQRSVK